MQKKKAKPGGVSRVQRRKKEYELVAMTFDQEIIDFKTNIIGEPSIVPSAIINESGEIFNETTELRLSQIRKELGGKTGDLAKRRAKGINLMLESPETPRAPETLDSLIVFVQNNWNRIKRFGKTLRNKRKLSPAAERELGL